MKINELNISEFGCFKDKKITFGDDMNIIYGENESGKSTVLLFIKFMLYGLGRRSASNSDRERSISWQGHVAAGSMSFSHIGKQYRIERRFSDSSRSGSERLSVICLDDGAEITLDKEPGEYFLGVPKEVFESSACVSQMGAADINGEKTAASIQNLMGSADERVDTAKIKKSLDSVRVLYRHKTGNGGSLYELEREISAQKQKLEKAREDSVLLEEQMQKLDVAQREYDVTKRDFDVSDNLLSELHKISILQRFDEASRRETELLERAEERRAFARGILKTRFFPTNQHLAELRLSAKALDDADRRFEEKKKEKEKHEVKYDTEAALLGEKIEKRGGADAILAFVREKKQKSKKITALCLAFGIIGALLSAISIPLVLLGMFWGYGFLTFLSLPIVFMAVGIKKKKNIKAEISETAREFFTDTEGLFAKLEYCLKNLALSREASVKKAKFESELEETQRLVSNANGMLASLLEKTDPDLTVSVENALGEYERLERFAADYERMMNDEAALKKALEIEKKALEQYDEEDLRAQVGTDVSELTPNAITEAQRVRGFLGQKKNVLEHKIVGLRDSVIQLKANLTDPIPIADNIAELEKKYEKDTEFYSALELAMESIEKAGAAISGNVMPVISEQAGELMGRISGDKYTTLRTTSNLSLTVDNDGYGIKSEYLSAGTRDAAYLALRMSLFMRIYSSELPPLILDEALCQLDDVRAERLLTLLDSFAAENAQCIIFTSHKREARICDEASIKHTLIAL